MTEFNQKLDLLFSNLGGANEFCWPRAQVFVNTYGAIGFLENGGLMGFWSNDLRQKKIIRSFRKIGANRFAKILEESKQTWEVIKDGDYDQLRKALGELRFQVFSRLEDEMFGECENAMRQVQLYVDRYQIEARPLGYVGRICASLCELGQWLVYWVPFGIAHLWSFIWPGRGK